MEVPPPVIAIVDDEPLMRKALRRLLAIHGFRVCDYESGEDFLAALSTHPVDCLLVDLRMPGLSGFGVMEILRTRECSPPVVVVTAHDDAGAEQRARSLGAGAYLGKPVDEAALLVAIRAALAPVSRAPL